MFCSAYFIWLSHYFIVFEHPSSSKCKEWTHAKSCHLAVDWLSNRRTITGPSFTRACWCMRFTQYQQEFHLKPSRDFTSTSSIWTESVDFNSLTSLVESSRLLLFRWLSRVSSNQQFFLIHNLQLVFSSQRIPAHSPVTDCSESSRGLGRSKVYTDSCFNNKSN